MMPEALLPVPIVEIYALVPHPVALTPPCLFPPTRLILILLSLFLPLLLTPTPIPMFLPEEEPKEAMIFLLCPHILGNGFMIHQTLRHSDGATRLLPQVHIMPLFPETGPEEVLPAHSPPVILLMPHPLPPTYR